MVLDKFLLHMTAVLQAMAGIKLSTLQTLLLSRKKPTKFNFTVEDSLLIAMSFEKWH